MVLYVKHTVICTNAVKFGIQLAYFLQCQHFGAW